MAKKGPKKTPKAPKAGPKKEEPIPEPNKEESVPEPKKEELAPEPKKEEPKPEPKKEEPKPEPKKEELAPELKKEEPKPELKKEEPKPELKKEESKPEPKKEEPAPELKKEESKLEPKKEEPAPELKKEVPKTSIIAKFSALPKQEQEGLNKEFKAKYPNTQFFKKEGKELKLTSVAIEFLNSINLPEPEKKEESTPEPKKEEPKVGDLSAYLKDIQSLGTDFSDLQDIDLDELKDMQAAIAQVKQEEAQPSPSPAIETGPSPTVETEAQKESLLTDFSDMGDMDMTELREMKEAMESVKQEETKATPEGAPPVQPKQELSKELEEKIKAELQKRKEVEEEKVVTAEDFVAFAQKKREKAWYHALYYIVFKTEDYIASKAILYDQLKFVTSKSPIDPIAEHQFYFGLGTLLRLMLYDKQIIRYMTGGRFKINVDIDNLKNLLYKVGEPISTRPVIKKEEKKKMFTDFLKDNFLDI